MFDFFDSICHCVTCRDQEDLATSVNESLQTLQDLINKDAGLLQKMTHEAFLGLQIAKTWTQRLLKNQIIYGCMLAHWLSQSFRLVRRKRQCGSGEITELVPEVNPDSSWYEHGTAYLKMLKGFLGQVGVFSRSSVHGPSRLAPVTEEQMEQSINNEIQLANLNLLDTCFERMSLRPETCPMFDVLEGTLPMYTRPAVIGRVNFMVSFQPHIFMTEAALGLSSEGDTEKSSWWVALDGKYYLYMSRVINQEGHPELKWYKCGLTCRPEFPNQLSKATLDKGWAMLKY